MAWETGTANNNVDLFDKLATFLSTNSSLVAAGQDWEVVRNTTHPNSFPAPARLAYSRNNGGGIPAYGTVAPDAPPGQLPVTRSKARYSGTLIAPTTGNYVFSVVVVEQCEIRIDGVLVFSLYSNNGQDSFQNSFTMTGLAAGNHTIQVDVFTRGDGYMCMALGWKKPGDSAFSIIPAANYSGMTAYWGYADSNQNSATGFGLVLADKEYVFRGKGLSNQDNIYTIIRTSSDYQGDAYNARIFYSIGKSDIAPTDQWPGLSPSSPWMTLWNQSMKYWFIANGRRFIVIAKVSTLYANMYGGFYLPYGLPTEIPYPIAVGANSRYNGRWSANALDTHSFWNPASNNNDSGNTSLVLRRTSGNYCTFASWGNYSNNYAGKTYPYYSNPGYRSSSDNNYGLIPIALLDSGEGNNVWGELDDVYHVSGFQNASENIITISGQDYLVVQGSTYTGINDYAAIALR
jgi:hypothetical protein